MDSEKANQVMEKLRGLEEKIKMSIPSEQVIVEETRLFGRFVITQKVTFLDLKDNWVIRK